MKSPAISSSRAVFEKRRRISLLEGHGRRSHQNDIKLRRQRGHCSSRADYDLSRVGSLIHQSSEIYFSALERLIGHGDIFVSTENCSNCMIEKSHSILHILISSLVRWWKTWLVDTMLARVLRASTHQEWQKYEWGSKQNIPPRHMANQAPEFTVDDWRREPDEHQSQIAKLGPLLTRVTAPLMTNYPPRMPPTCSKYLTQSDVPLISK